MHHQNWQRLTFNLATRGIQPTSFATIVRDLQAFEQVSRIEINRRSGVMTVFATFNRLADSDLEQAGKQLKQRITDVLEPHGAYKLATTRR